MDRVSGESSIYRRPGRALAPLALVALLSACAQWQDDTLAKPPEQPKHSIVRAAEPAVTVPKPPPSPTNARIALMAPKPHPRPFRLAPYAPIESGWGMQPFGPVAPEVIEPVDVVGLTEDETVNLLGEPDWRAWRPPSRVLRYASNGCSVDIYFYLDVAKDKFQALQLKASEAATDESSLQTCLGKVRNEHRTR